MRNSAGSDLESAKLLVSLLQSCRRALLGYFRKDFFFLERWSSGKGSACTDPTGSGACLGSIRAARIWEEIPCRGDLPDALHGLGIPRCFSSSGLWNRSLHGDTGPGFPRGHGLLRASPGKEFPVGGHFVDEVTAVSRAGMTTETLGTPGHGDTSASVMV